MVKNISTANSADASRHVMTEVHTPTPWTAFFSVRNQKTGVGDWVFMADNRPLLRNGPRSAKDAAFIVCAVNAHDDLVKALEWAIDCLDNEGQASAAASLNTTGRDALSRARGAA